MRDEVRDYVAAVSEYNERLGKWIGVMGRIGTPPKAPAIPQYLALWFELNRWPGHLLVDGGLMDQPSWTWEMVDLAGLVYREEMARG